MPLTAVVVQQLVRADRPWLVVPTVLAAAYLVSVGILLGRDRSPDLPWSFVPFLLLLSLPCALVLVSVTDIAGRFRKFPKLIWVALGVATVWYSVPHVLWPVLALVGIGMVGKLRTIRFAGRLSVLMALLVVGYAAVWNFNSVLAPLSVGRLGDPWLVAVDQWLLSSATYDGVFPVIESRGVFALLERSYLFLFAEILTVTLWMAAYRPADAYLWIARLFTAYAIGLLIFLIWPTVGPHIYAPESLRPAWHDTRTFRTMQAMAIDYERIVAGGRGGMNYFIAFPSLHVAAAVVCQIGARDSGALFWALLPATVLVASSTFLLGYHYALDVPAGFATAIAASWLIDQGLGKRSASSQA